MFIIAHELFDALPIHQFKYLGGENWCEMVVKLEGIEYAGDEKITLDSTTTIDVDGEGRE